MSIYLGNITFSQVEEKLGYKLTEEDEALWDKFHSNNANLSKAESCFHIFDIPRCIQFKGEAAGAALLKIFTPEKITNPVGEFRVYKVK